MPSYNKVFLMGNLTRDPELTYTPSQVAICKFGLAINRRYKTKTGEEREDVLFVDCTCFDKRAEVIHQYCTKGKPIFIEGQLKMDTWEDKTTGDKRSKMYVIVDSFQFLGSKAGDDGDQSPPARAPARPASAPSRPAPGASPMARAREQAQQRARDPGPAPFPEDNTFKDDDIPF